MMRKVLLAIPIIAMIVFIILITCNDRLYRQQTVPHQNMIIDSTLTDSLRAQLDRTIDSFKILKPAIEAAIAKLRYYDSVVTTYKPIDSVYIARLKIDLYEARLEIQRLAAPRYFIYH